MIQLPMYVGVIVCGLCFLSGFGWGMYEATRQVRAGKYRPRGHSLHGQ